MSRAKWAGGYLPVYLTVAAIWLSGAVWLLFHYFIRIKTAFGDAPSPFEHWLLVLHGAAAFCSLWLIGFLWGTHIVKRWRLRRHRKTGGLLFGVMLLLILTGYLLYYVADDDWRAATSITHWVIGLGMPLALLWHWAIRRR